MRNINNVSVSRSHFSVARRRIFFLEFRSDAYKADVAWNTTSCYTVRCAIPNSCLVPAAATRRSTCVNSQGDFSRRSTCMKPVRCQPIESVLLTCQVAVKAPGTTRVAAAAATTATMFAPLGSGFWQVWRQQPLDCIIHQTPCLMQCRDGGRCCCCCCLLLYSAAVETWLGSKRRWSDAEGARLLLLLPLTSVAVHQYDRASQVPVHCRSRRQYVCTIPQPDIAHSVPVSVACHTGYCFVHERQTPATRIPRVMWAVTDIRAMKVLAQCLSTRLDNISWRLRVVSRWPDTCDVPVCAFPFFFIRRLIDVPSAELRGSPRLLPKHQLSSMTMKNKIVELVTSHFDLVCVYATLRDLLKVLSRKNLLVPINDRWTIV